MTLRVALIGAGAIGSRVAELLLAGAAPDAELAGVVLHDAAEGGLEFAEALAAADVVVECAGVGSVAQYGPAVIAGGKDLLLTSIGALCDPALRSELLDGGPGRTFLTTGALGGLDAITAAATGGEIRSIRIESRKMPASLIQSWMDGTTRQLLLKTEHAIELLRGSPAALIEAFPRSTNIVSALALAAGNWNVVEAVLMADPEARQSTHRVLVDSTLGNFQFSITNEPSPGNPSSSALVPHAVVRGLKTLARPSGSFI